MTIIADLLLPTLLAYTINLASGERSAAIAAKREASLKKVLDEDESLRKALTSTNSIRDDIRSACHALARDRSYLGVPRHEEPLWALIADDTFQADLADWLMTGEIEEGNEVKRRLRESMSSALARGSLSRKQIDSLTNRYFEAIERSLIAHPILAHWRLQLSLDYLRGQVTDLQRRAEEAAGVYSKEKTENALKRYCTVALNLWDIIDLSSLPEGDVQITMQKILLRQLYMPLRIEIEQAKRGEDANAALVRLEQERDARRRREAGRYPVFELGSLASNPELKTRSPLGELLAVSRRLVVLGDPGGGKTTMLRWLATAYLLLNKDERAFREVPDTDTLPKTPWIPVLIRCRDLGEADLCRCFTDFLTQHLKKTELYPEEAEIMLAVILDRIAKGQALLLVDGLDEITNPKVRMQFCQELERTATRYPNVPIVVTSRIVGYRDMPYRMGTSFEHGVIAELSREDKDLFAQRWIQVTKQHLPVPERAKHVKELIEALHSSDRIERLTGNPMLLTTLALVKRKVGKLPNRRTKLYAEAVSVLLNWNPGLYQTIEEDEAIPQLEYLAYDMCRRGVQRLSDSEVLELLDNLRIEYPKIRAIQNREPRDFLNHLEQRSSILIRSGGTWHKNDLSEQSVWEFRHLTFQEYLAARALLDGRYPGRGKPKSLADQVAPLAGAMEKSEVRGTKNTPGEEIDVSESWREALRLLVADCKDDDVDDILKAILLPARSEDAVKTARPRAVLAALCLADEPNVSEEVATFVLAEFVAKISDLDGNGPVQTSLDRAALEVAGSIWSQKFKFALMGEFDLRPSESRDSVGGVLGMTELARFKRLSTPPKDLSIALVERLQSGDRLEVVSAALTIMEAAFEGRVEVVDNLTIRLLELLTWDDRSANHAAAWALAWLSRGSARTTKRSTVWVAKGDELDSVIAALEVSPLNETITRRWIVEILGRSRDRRALRPLLGRLDDSDPDVRKEAIEALVMLDHKQAVTPLLAKLDDPDSRVRITVVKALGTLRGKRAVRPLIARLHDLSPAIRKAAVEALVKLRDQRAVEPLIAMLDEADENVRWKVIEALGRFGDRRAVDPLAAKLHDQDTGTVISTAITLHLLGDSRGIGALAPILTSDDYGKRQAAVHAYAQLRDQPDRTLLSRDLDAVGPWLDPLSRISEEDVSKAADRLSVSPDQVRSRFEQMADDLGLRLDWRLS